MYLEMALHIVIKIRQLASSNCLSPNGFFNFGFIFLKLQDIAIGNRADAYLSRPSTEHNVVKGCAVTDPCLNVRCPDNADCLPRFDTHTCKCRKGIFFSRLLHVGHCIILSLFSTSLKKIPDKVTDTFCDLIIIILKNVYE